MDSSKIDVNLEYYKVFYYVAKMQSFTEAARKLNLSQPAVSQQIRMLEKKLDVVLFVRKKKGAFLTDEGAILYEYIERAFAEITKGENSIMQLKKLEIGEVRVGASDMTLRFYLLPFLEKFHELHPGIKVTVTNAPTPETLKFLEEDKIDFGVVSSPFDESTAQNFDFKDVKQIQDCFVAGRHFTSFKNHMIDVKELEKMPIISLEGDTSSGKYVNDFLKKYDVDIHPEFELATSDMIVQFAKRSLGVGMVVRDFAKDDIESGKLFELRLKQRIPPRQIRVVTSKNNKTSIAAGKLLELLKKRDD